MPDDNDNRIGNGKVGTVVNSDNLPLNETDRPGDIDLCAVRCRNGNIGPDA